MLLKGVFLSFAAKEHELEGPRPGPDSLFVPHLKGYEIRQRSCPPQGARPFLHPFCGRLDKKDGVWRHASRRFCFDLKSKEQQINDLLLSGYGKNSKGAIYPYAKKTTSLK